MQALADRLHPYQATRVASQGITGLWRALSNVVGDASVLTPDPVSDARVDEICAEEAQRAIFSHLATLPASEPGRTGFLTPATAGAAPEAPIRLLF
jgi:hypothetical protein